MRYSPSGIGLSTPSGTGTTMAIGSFGLRPGPSVRRIAIWPSFNGVSHDMSAKRLAWSNEVLSTLETHRLMEVGVWRRNGISPDTTKGRFLWIKGYFRWYLTTNSVEQIVHFPRQSRCYEKKSRRVLNGRTISDLWKLYIRLCSTRKLTPPSGLQGASSGV